MSVVKEFKAFLAKGNVVDLAVAVIIGAAFSKIVTVVNAGIFMPIIGKLLPGGDWRTATVTSLNLEVGAVLAATIDFMLTALIVFLMVVKVMGALKRKEAAAPPAPPEPTGEEKLLAEIRDLLKQQRA
jgi:large conductance mechanosensitive channel